MIIQSLQNAKVKHVVQLQNKNYRHQHQQFLAQGFKVCSTLLAAGFHLDSIYMTEPMYLAHQNDFLILETHIVTDAIMQKISTTTTPTGIVGIFAMPKKERIASANAVVLHSLQDPGNLGTLIRSASAMGIDVMYLVDCADVYNPKVIQATAGCLKNLNIIQDNYTNIKALISGIPTCALVVHSGKLPQQIPVQQVILIIGNEGQGLPQAIIQESTYQMTLPMPGNAESLNAAVAGSIAMYLKSQAL